MQSDIDNMNLDRKAVVKKILKDYEGNYVKWCPTILSSEEELKWIIFPVPWTKNIHSLSPGWSQTYFCIIFRFYLRRMCSDSISCRRFCCDHFFLLLFFFFPVCFLFPQVSFLLFQARVVFIKMCLILLEVSSCWRVWLFSHHHILLQEKQRWIVFYIICLDMLFNINYHLMNRLDG